MTKLYKIASIIYRLVLAILTPLTFLTFAVTDENEYNNSKLKGTLAILFIVVTIALLTIYENFITKPSMSRKIIWLFLIGLITLNIIFILEFLYNMLFIYKNLAIGDSIATFIIFLFGLVSITVLLGLIKKEL